MTRRYGGTGLGLILSKKLAQALGGDLKLINTELGKGSTFELTITPEQSEVDTFIIHKGQRDTARAQTQLDNLKVLVVEDCLDIQVLVSKYLKSAKAEIEIASNGREGFQRAMTGKFDVVLMDISMPELDGFQATEKLRHCGFKKPIIAMSAHAMREEKKRAIDVGFNDYITKPMNRSLLIEKIAFYSHEMDFKQN